MNLRLIEPKMAVSPAARMAAEPFVTAIREVATAAGGEDDETSRHGPVVGSVAVRIWGAERCVASSCTRP